jgi:chemosensory pili system protein ChpA (sensor histidine kinase/response regulator)
MTEQRDREFLLSIFLMEAWDTVSTLEEGAGSLREGGDLEPLLVVTHRLRGAAALHGFPALAAEAAELETMLEHAETLAHDARSPLAEVLEGGVARLRDLLERVGPETAPPAEPAPAPRAGAGGPLLDELARFYAENGDVLEYFGPEAVEHLETITHALLALERGASPDAEVATLFRAFHTLKGAAYTVGCHPIGDLAHRVEDLLVAVREGRLSFTPATVEAVFAGADAVRFMLSAANERPAGLESTVSRARALVEAALGAPAAAGEAAPAEPALAEASAADPARPTAEAMEPAVAGWSAAPSARASIRVSVERLDSLMNLVGELVVARSRLDDHLTQLDRVGELLLWSRSRMAQAVQTFEGKHEYTQLAALPAAHGSGGGAGLPPAEPHSGAFVHDFEELEFDRYDDFNILSRRVAEVSADVAEVQTQLAGLIRVIREDSAQVQRLTWRLRGDITRSRMVPIGRLFGRHARQVREVARAAGKTVDLEVAGGGVELDNTIIEQIADPLLHLVQNAVFHGIEPAAERRRLGKAEHGTVSLRAYHVGGAVYVEVEDDGRGLDADRLRASAVRGGFLDAAAASYLSEREALDLVFLPGFSTAEVATSAAGRGVGMDVVRTNVLGLGGEIDVETEVGVGTRFTLKLPLTVLIGEALGVRVGSVELAIPVTAIRGLYSARPDEIRTGPDGETVEIEGQELPLLRLGRVLGVAADPPGRRLSVVALRAGRRLLAAVVDELLGKSEIVVKSLGAFLDGAGPWSGATVSGEGRVILLLDPTRLAETQRGDAPRVGASRPAPAHPSAPRSDAPRVLLVDDSLSVRKFIGLMLERAGFEVRMAADGGEALNFLADTVVDVVVTDLEMPRVNGFELVQDLRRRAETRALPVVILTTRAGEKHLELARRLGVQHYVTKPVDERAFVALVAGLVSARAPAGGAP